MARFQDDQQVYAQLGGMFEDALADDAAGARLRKIGGTVQWELRKPAARITVKLGEDVAPGVDFGRTDVKPEVVLTMEADTAHRFWAGELPMHVALSRGLIRAKGPVATILRIVPVVGPAKDLYAARLAGGGAAAAEAPEAEGDTPVEMDEAAVVEEVLAEEAVAEEPVAVEEAEAPAEEPVAVEEAEAPAEEPVAVEEAEAPAEEPVAVEEAEAPAEEPVAVEEAEAPAEEPEAPAEEPVAVEEAEAPAEEPAEAPAEEPTTEAPAAPDADA